MTIWVEVRNHLEVRMPEWLNAFYLTLWGAYVILHPGMMGRNVLFSGLLDLAPQEVWGLAALIVGGVRVGALWINGRWHITPIIRVVTSFVSVFVWFWICVGLYRSGEPQTGLVIYPGLMIADMLSAFRAASDAYEAEAVRRLKILSESSNVASIRSSK